jgi:hypothetical protein
MIDPRETLDKVRYCGAVHGTTFVREVATAMEMDPTVSGQLAVYLTAEVYRGICARELDRRGR